MILATVIHNLDNSATKRLPINPRPPTAGIAVLMSIIAVISACASENVVFTTSLDHKPAECLRFYHALDDAVFFHDVEDSGEMRVPGFPFLRANRFLASFRHDDLTSQAYALWLDLLRQTDEHARLLEYANLPDSAEAQIAARIPTGFSFRQYLHDCGRSLVKTALSQDASARSELSALTAVSDHYQSWKRAIGLYPLVSLFAKATLDDLHRKLNEPFQQPKEQILLLGKPIRYRPNTSPLLSQQAVAAILEAAYQNPMQAPLLPPDQLAKLFAQFAPVWEIDTRNNSDRIGRMTFDDAGHPKADIHIPTVYVKHAYSRYHGETLLQLLYQIWLPEREKTGWFDLYGGELDSVIWRVSLNRRGELIAYDSVHACGCYYLLFPGKGYRAAPNRNDAEAVLSPKVIDSDPYKQRLMLRLAARTHYLQQVSPAQTDNSANRYRLQSYDDLRSLASEDGQRRNLFGPDGIIEVSHRTERFLLWPFGVDSPGAMRQWGSHAIAFIGRRHFDDAFLLEKLLLPIK